MLLHNYIHFCQMNLSQLHLLKCFFSRFPLLYSTRTQLIQTGAVNGWDIAKGGFVCE